LSRRASLELRFPSGLLRALCYQLLSAHISVTGADSSARPRPPRTHRLVSPRGVQGGWCSARRRRRTVPQRPRHRHVSSYVAKGPDGDTARGVGGSASVLHVVKHGAAWTTVGGTFRGGRAQGAEAMAGPCTPQRGASAGRWGTFAARDSVSHGRHPRAARIGSASHRWRRVASGRSWAASGGPDRRTLPT
jgi:hypothetical protein